MRNAYIAMYPPDKTYDEREVVIARDYYWSTKLSELWDRLMSAREPGDPMLQGWYSDDESVFCMASTGLPTPTICNCCGLSWDFVNSAPNPDNEQ